MEMDEKGRQHHIREGVFRWAWRRWRRRCRWCWRR
jgi:hypothetical protein